MLRFRFIQTKVIDTAHLVIGVIDLRTAEVAVVGPKKEETLADRVA